MTKSEKIAAQIARLEEEKRAAIAAEREADQAELLRLVARADCLPAALEWARSMAGGRHAKPVKNQQEVQ
jgi:hypothetical protein